MAKVVLQHITKHFDGTAAVKDVNLTIADREFVVLVGPSGCGKTTTLRMIAGLEEVTRGKIFIGDRLVNTLPPKDRDIAMVFQNYALYPHMKISENMAFGLKMRRVSKEERDQAVKGAAEILGIEDLLDRKPRQLSGGQRQRVALGRAIVRKPEVFLFDEPLSNLDAKLRVQMRTELKKLHHRLQATAIYVTHDQVEAMTMGDRIVVMNDGVVQQVGTPRELYNTPANLFVAGFIGSPAMNLLPCRIVGENLSLSVDTGDFTIPLPESLASTVHEAKDRALILGIRPEDLHEPHSGQRTSRSIRGTVNVIEPLGKEILFDITTGTHSLKALLGADTAVQHHQDIELAVNSDKIHLFHGEGGEAVI
jgi:multiple sugar transport system ATP-binding protein